MKLKLVGLIYSPHLQRTGRDGTEVLSKRPCPAPAIAEAAGREKARLASPWGRGGAGGDIERASTAPASSGRDEEEVPLFS